MNFSFLIYVNLYKVIYTSQQLQFKLSSNQDSIPKKKKKCCNYQDVKIDVREPLTLSICRSYYLGFGLFFTIFFPYFLHLNPSSSISTSDIVLKANLSLTSLLSRPLPPSPIYSKKHPYIDSEHERDIYATNIAQDDIQ